MHFKQIQKYKWKIMDGKVRISKHYVIEALLDNCIVFNCF